MATAVDLEQDSLKGLGFGIDHPVASQHGCATQELGHCVELGAQRFARGFRRIGNGVCPDGFQFLLVILGQLRLLGHQTLLILGSEVLVMADLLFSLGSSSLQSTFPQVLGPLVTVDLLLLDQLVKRLIRVFGKDGIDLGTGILRK